MMYDAAVLGLGGMGSAALAHLARRGQRAVGIEQFGRLHDRGSSAGQSRIIRMAYYEDPAYVPLLRRAYELWAELERDAAARLLDFCGVLMLGALEGRLLRGAIASARSFGIALERFGPAQIRRRYPMLHARDGEAAVLEPRAGTIFPEAAIDAHLRVAARAGAEMRFNTAVRGFTPEHDGLTIDLDDGARIRARRLAICAGPWATAVLRELTLPLRVERTVQVWFDTASAAYSAPGLPSFFADRADLPAMLYGFPDYGCGLKAALHGAGTPATPGRLDRSIADVDIAAVKSAVDGLMPAAAATFRSGKACMYTLTPDEHFIIDAHPQDARVVIAAGFSGHGFKFCSVVGEIVTDLVTTGGTRHPIGFLSLRRFRVPEAASALLSDHDFG